MKAFTVGPVAEFPCTHMIHQRDLPYFRSAEFSCLVNKCIDMLSAIIGHKNSNSVFYMTCSGSGAMEAVVDNCVGYGEKSLVINGGTFGHRFCEILKKHNRNYDSIDLEWNEELTKSRFTGYDKKKYQFLFVNIHETSTGHLYDLSLLSKFAKENGMYLIVDAISSILADDYEMDKYGVDATIFSSQKGLCLSPGLSFIALSSELKDKVLREKNSTSYYFNFESYINNINRGQTPFTPANMIIYELDCMLDLIMEKGGKSCWIESVKQKSLYFRDKIRKEGIEIPSGYNLSNALTPIFFNDIDAMEIYRFLSQKFSIYVNPCGGELASKLLRVAHIGNLSFADFDDLVNKLKIAIQSVKTNDRK